MDRKIKCTNCGKSISDRPDKKTQICNDCWQSKRCKDCGQRLGIKKHICIAVSKRGKRYCIDCKKLLNNKNKFERYNHFCTTCGGKRKRTVDKQRRLQIKQEFGGRCSKCGYEKCQDALHFHHKNGRLENEPKGSVRLTELKKYPKRFILLCANCHIELHAKEKQKGANQL